MLNQSPDLNLDRLFHALADPARRAMVERLSRGPAPVSELARPLPMSLPAVMQHLDVLEAANLIATVRRGREKLHFLNPVPLQEIYDRWIAKFERPRLKALGDLKRKLEKAHG